MTVSTQNMHLLDCILSLKQKCHKFISKLEVTLEFMLHHAAIDGQGQGSGVEFEFFLPASNPSVSAGNLN